MPRSDASWSASADARSTPRATGSSRCSTDPRERSGAPSPRTRQWRSWGSRSAPGVHTGEVELAGTGIRGLAVHVGARIAGLAQAGEVLVSRTVRDLVSGSGIVFLDRGEHTLKGVPDPWQVFTVESV